MKFETRPMSAEKKAKFMKSHSDLMMMSEDPNLSQKERNFAKRRAVAIKAMADLGKSIYIPPPNQR